MKHLVSFIFILVITRPLTFAADDRNLIPSFLKSVTVYRTAAELSHTAKANLKKGNNEIIIEGLSNKLDVSSLQIGSDGNLTIMSVEYSMDYLKPVEKSAVVNKLEETLATLQKHWSDVQVILKTDYELLELLKANKEIRGTQTGLNVSELIKMMDYYKMKMGQLQNEINQYKEKEKLLNDDMKNIQNQIGQEEQKNVRSSGRLLLQLNSPLTAAYNFTISYLSQNAYWTPFYDLRVQNISKPLQIVYKAKIIQSTGIDWKQVKLTLSTSTPNQNGSAPVLSTWFLSYLNPIIRRNSFLKQNQIQAYGAPVAKSMAPVSADKEMNNDMGDYVWVADKELNVTFNIDLPYDVASNGKEQTVALKEYEVPAIYKFYAAPKLDQDAYLLAEIQDWEKLNLLPGEANIIFEGVYVGKSFIDPNSVNDTLNITLGRDKRVVVKREKLVDFSSQKFVGSNKKQIFTYELTVKNNKKEKLQLLLKDQFPLSTNKEIEVEILETSGGSVNNDNGVVTWKLDLAPGENKKVRISYAVKFPKDRIINAH
jgi:uncharacterized protein (TIGR02231 family)